MFERIVNASAIYLARKGYEVLASDYDTDSTFNIVAVSDHGSITFIKVYGEDAEFAHEPKMNRSQAERFVIEWLSNHSDEEPAPIEFDTICVKVLDDGKAFLRHHTDVLHEA